MNNTKIDFSSVIPGELWMEVILPYLEAKNLNNVQRVSKFFNEIVNQAEVYWTRVTEKRGIPLPDYICRTCTNLSVIEGTLESTFQFLEKRNEYNEDLEGKFHYLTDKNNPIIWLDAFNSNGCSFVAQTWAKIQGWFGHYGLSKWEEDPEGYLLQKNVKTALKQYTTVNKSFPITFPVKFFVNREDGDRVLIKHSDQLFRLKLVKNFKSNLNYVIQVSNNVSLPWDKYNIDRSYTDTFIDLDKEKYNF